MRIRVLLVDDHPVVQTGLRTALEREEIIGSVEVAGSLSEAFEVLGTSSADVGLVDVRLPDGTGFDLISAWRGRSDRPAWIVLSTFDQTEYVAAAIHRGASGYLLKTARLDEIVDAIRRVAVGGTAFDESMLARVSAAHVRFTRRERQVIAGVVRGRSNDEIAADLGVARKTIEAYLGRLFDRLGLSSRVELAVMAEREGWLDVDPAPRQESGFPP